MSSLSFTVLFVVFLVISLLLRFWLASRHIRHIMAHSDAVPAQFADKIPLKAHQRAAAYSIAKTKFAVFVAILNAAVLIGFTLLGGLQWLSEHLFFAFGPGWRYQLGLVLSFILISGLVELPFDYFRQFVLEARFGFNRMSPRLFFTDLVKSSVFSIAFAMVLVGIALFLMQKTGDFWWLYAWLVWCGFQMLMLVVVPLFIAPMFNKFKPLEDESLKSRIENLMQRVGFAANGLFVMDGSKRSAHGNAYFSGFGASKRIVFFDTLLERLTPAEVEAVMAHELGHFKLKHITKRIAFMFIASLGFLALLGFLKTQTWFYTGLGLQPIVDAAHPAINDAAALILFALVLPVFSFVFSPLTSLGSRKHEFEADAFAVEHTNAPDLVSALVKLYEDNASTLTPDPLHSAFYDSHPPATVRIGRLLAHS